MDKKYLQLVRDIRDAVREKAQEIPKFRDDGNGCVRVLFYPCCKEADDDFGGLSDFRFHDIADYEFTFAITPGGSRVISYDTSNSDGRKVDCYAFSALKIAHCSAAQDMDEGLLSGIIKDPNLTEECGYGPYAGALCVEVERINTAQDTDGFFSYTSEKKYCNIYVSVSGADSLSDLRCAFAAIDVIVDFFASTTDSFMYHYPSFPAK